MNYQFEKQENSLAKFTIEVPAERLDKAILKVFNETKNSFSIPGFRKGKVPFNVIERMYGASIFYEDAANDIISEEYTAVLDDCDEEICSNPQVDIVQIEKGKPFIFTALVATKPELRLGKYRGVEVSKSDAAVSEEEIDKRVDEERDRNSRTVTVEDRAVQDGDIAVIDFKGFADGVAFEGGEGENHPLTIGSGQFIPGFEEQLIGANAGDEVDVNVTFPEEYHSTDLAGKAALFKVTVKEIKTKIIPEANDDFASEVSEFDTMAEYRDSLRKELAERKGEAARRKKENEALDEVIKDSHVEIPEIMIETQQQQMVNDFANRIRMQGLDINTYFQYTGQTREDLMEQFKPEAEHRIKMRLALDAVAEAEGLAVTDEDIEEEYKKIAELYGNTPEKIKEITENDPKGMRQMKTDILCNKALSVIADAAVEVEKPAEDKTEE